ncbi:hypothetical protein WAJ58_22975, partial [Acinetobacter baumannii]
AGKGFAGIAKSGKTKAYSKNSALSFINKFRAFIKQFLTPFYKCIFAPFEGHCDILDAAGPAIGDKNY